MKHGMASSFKKQHTQYKEFLAIFASTFYNAK